MNSLSPYNFSNPIATARGLASDALQKWMLTVYDFLGTPYKNFQNPACSAPGFNLASYTYRLTGGDCQVNILFDFTGGLGTDYAISLPVPALANFGLLTCYMNSVGQPVISAVALILSDGLLHFAMSGAATFPTGTVTCSISGRYSL